MKPKTDPIGVDELRKVRDKLMDDKRVICAELAKIDGELLESKIRYDEDGTIKPAGWYARMKERQANLTFDKKAISQKIDDVKERIRRSNRCSLGEVFMDIARRLLDEGTYEQCLASAQEQAGLRASGE